MIDPNNSYITKHNLGGCCNDVFMIETLVLYWVAEVHQMWVQVFFV